MKWREKWAVDDLDSWDEPEVFKAFVPNGTTGFDKEGSPIIIIPFAGVDIWGLLHSAPKHDIVKNTIKVLEGEISHIFCWAIIINLKFPLGFMRIAYEQSKEYGPEARKFVVIFDMDNFSMKQYAYRPAAELVIQTFQLYSNNYPEILKYCYIINGESVSTTFVANKPV